MTVSTAGASRRMTAAAALRMTVVLLCVGASLPAQQTLTLQQSVDLAQKQGYDAASAIATRDAAEARERAFSRRRLPQLSFTGIPAELSKNIQPVVQSDGSTAFLPVQESRARGGLTLSQQFPLTGATFSITSSLQRYEKTGVAVPQLTYNTSPWSFEIRQPVFKANPQKWEARVEEATLTAAEQQYLEDREGVAISATEAFFDLFVARKQLDNAEQNASRNDTLFTINKGRLEVGKIGENDLLQSELSLLRSRSQAENAQLDYLRALAAFRLAVNLPANADVQVVAPDGVPSLVADTLLAVEQAMKNSARIRSLDVAAISARRQVVSAGLNRFPGADVTASFGVNQTADEFDAAYRDPLEAQRVRVQVSVPLFSFGALGADAQAARANFRRVDANS